MHLTEAYFAALRQILPELRAGSILLHAPSRLREGALRPITWFGKDLPVLEQGYATLQLAALHGTAMAAKALESRQFITGVLEVVNDGIQKAAGTGGPSGPDATGEPPGDPAAATAAAL